MNGKKIWSFALVVFLFLGLFGASTNASAPGEPVKIIGMSQPAASFSPTDEDVLAEIHQKILDETGVDFEIIVGPVDSTEYTTKLNLMLAGNERIDCAQLPGIYPQMLMQGALADITEALANYGQDIVATHGPNNMIQMEKDGRYYGIPRHCDVVTYYTWVRGDWLELYGLEAPTTIDELENVLKVFKENDPAGDGTTVPLLAGDFWQVGWSLGGCWLDNGWTQWVDADGRIKPFYVNPQYKDFLSKMAEWYREGYVLKDTTIIPWGDNIEMITGGRVGVVGIWYSIVTLNEGAMQANFPDAYYVRCDITGPAGIGQTANTVFKLPGPSGATNLAACVVFEGCQDVDAAIKALNWGYQGTHYIESKYGPNGAVFTPLDGGMYSVKVLKDQQGDEYQGMYKCLQLEQPFLYEGGSGQARHLQYLSLTANEVDNFAATKMPIDGGLFYDAAALLDACPGYPDIDRIQTEARIAFITGERSLDTFEAYLEELNQAGIDDLIDEMTRQYDAWKK